VHLTVLDHAIATADLSVCLSVTFRCFVKTSEDMIVRSSVSGRTIILVSEEVKFIRIFEGDNRPTCTFNAYVCLFFRSVFV